MGLSRRSSYLSSFRGGLGGLVDLIKFSTPSAIRGPTSHTAAKPWLRTQSRWVDRNWCTIASKVSPGSRLHLPKKDKACSVHPDLIPIERVRKPIKESLRRPNLVIAR